ncbi:potassium channel subfamily K member 1-like isoform X1 [Planococcus citri]|uniref:potassium channel subfamily K member 1-like isoform X1 n=1 Tax=Planococcus citri TaxID=170843 RepID=UPI0031F94E99
MIQIANMESFRTAHFRKVYGFRRSSFLCCFFILFYAMYLITGALMFAALESPMERKAQYKAKEKLTQFLMEHSCISKKELNDLLTVALEANNNGVSFEGNDSYAYPSSESNWSFSQALFFTVTILTTIGYGRITPRTTAGKIFCILYIIVGLPLTLTLGTAVVQRVMIPILIFEQFLHKKLVHTMTPFQIKMLHFIVVTAFLLIFLLFIPAYVFSTIEPEWNYLDGLYYCFITLTTVGLGDYIPGDVPNQQYRALYKFFSTGYLFFSLLCVLVIVTMFNDIPQLNIGVLFNLESDTDGDSSERVHLNRRRSSVRNYTSASTNDLVGYDRVTTQTSLPESVEP